jgi:tyrosine decarboxylase/aspartate 1-decarboxylase
MKEPPFEFDLDSVRVLRAALKRLGEGFSALPAVPAPTDPAMERVLEDVAERLYDNYPYFHPLYAGQMLKPPHPVARLAYALALWVNPNNHALDGGRASSRMEKEAVAGLARMIGWDGYLGHLTGGGTMANLEALWVAGRMVPEGTIVASELAHYTHRRISGVLGLSFEEIPCDGLGRMDPNALETRLRRGGVSTVVATLGTTGPGTVDPLAEIVALRDRYGFRLHADAAYGGYFTLAGNLAEETRNAFDALAACDSVVIDPHKHGLQPHGCGCVLFRDPSVGRFYKHDSPYTYFSSDELHLGEISLECSRPGAAAVALWATQRLLPLVKGGAFAAGLDAGRQAALGLYERLRADRRFVTAAPPELDIVIWAPRSTGGTEGAARRIFDEAAHRGLHLAVAEMPARLFAKGDGPGAESERVTCLRSVLMKPEHLPWLDRIWSLLDEAAAGLGRSAS